VISRRSFLGTAAAATGAALLPAAETPLPIVDTHTHFYDPERPQGVPWPNKGDALLYRKVLPSEYIALAKPLGIVGTVVVEASPWVEDNQWLLDLAEAEPFLLGIVGNLNPLAEDFATNLARFTRSPKFVGFALAGVS
jgi:L-fuconolactonase